MTLPLNRADTGPTFIFAVARKPPSSVFSSSSQPGMQAFSTAGSLSFSQTASRGAASWTSPFIVMAMGTPPGSRNYNAAQVTHGRRTGKGKPGHVQCIFATAKCIAARFGIGRAGPWWLGRAQHEHIPLPPARPDAVERGHARRLRRPVDPAEHARF